MSRHFLVVLFFSLFLYFFVLFFFIFLFIYLFIDYIQIILSDHVTLKIRNTYIKLDL